MSVFGVDFYGLSLYGTDQVVDYNVDPFTAVSWNYDQIKISWQTPIGSWDLFRLVKNRRGYPVTESDGDILLETSGPPGTNDFYDIQPVPGRFHYYAIYLRTQTDPEEIWTRASVTSCLANEDWGSAEWMWERLPEYYRYSSNGELTTDQVGDSYLWQFVQVMGWGLDILKTQSDIAKHMNDPMRVHVSDLEEMGAELGIPFDPEIQGATMRQRVANGAHVDREKGTVAGWRNLINIMTGWDADVTIGKNLLLDDDQSSFVHPQFPDWSPYINYTAGEIVQFGRVWYRANSGGSYQDQPPGTTWTALSDEDDDTLLNPLTGGMSTWEGLSFTQGVESPSISNRLGIGMVSPTDPNVKNANMIFVRNSANQTVSAGLRSIARPLVQAATLTAAITATDTSVTLSAPETVFTAFPFYAWLDWGTANQECVQVTTQSGSTLTVVRGQLLTKAVAHAKGAGYWHKGSPTEPLDKDQPILDGIPVPWVRDSQVWNPNTEYATNDIVLYAKRPYIALRASKGATPPYPNWSTPNDSWAALGQDKRIALMLSGYTHQPPTFDPWAISAPHPETVPGNVYPFIEWYDRDGTAIGTRLAAKSPYVEGFRLADVATTSNLAGTRSGNVITGTNPGTLVIDGVTMGNGLVILVKNQTNAVDNGIYHVTNAGNSVTPFSITRAGLGNADVPGYENASAWFTNEMFHIRAGTTNGGKYFYVTTTGTITPNTTAINFGGPVTAPWYEPGLLFDSFSDDWDVNVDGRVPDVGSPTWSVPTGGWTVDAFDEGTIYPTNPTTASIATVNSGQKDCQVGITFKTSPNSSQGLVLRYVSGTNYIRATRTALELVTSSGVTTWGTYSTAAEDGDRIVVTMNGNVYHVYLLNGSDTQHSTPVLSYTDSSNTNLNATTHGVFSS